jgi:uncharacterized membrane protein
MADVWAFLGRFHPSVVHLPIGIFVLLGALECADVTARWRRVAWLPHLDHRHRLFVLLLASLSAITAVVLGWLLSETGEYDPELLNRHENLGLATACASVLLVILHRQPWLYRPGLVVTLVVLALAGHAGGTLTHGAGYLTEHLPAWLGRVVGLTPIGPPGPLPPADPAQLRVFGDIVQPILAQRCLGCHGPEKSNGDLRADTRDGLLRGGKHGPAVKPGSPASSALLQRVRLPLDHKEHMPPRGKPQLTETDVLLLEWWIDAGAPDQQKLIEMDPPAEIADIIAERFGVPPPDRAATLATAASLASRTGIVIRPVAPDAPWLMASARIKLGGFGDQQLSELVPIAPALHSLDLGETAVTDAGLASLTEMRALRRLHLDRTGITDAGLAHLAGLTSLESLNLHGTAITDAGLEHLHRLTRLRALYLWQTHVSTPAAEALAARLTDPRRARKWEQEIEELEKKIQADRVTVDFGAPPMPVADMPVDTSRLSQAPGVQPVK